MIEASKQASKQTRLEGDDDDDKTGIHTKIVLNSMLDCHA
jgi:hypothetical protein